MILEPAAETKALEEEEDSTPRRVKVYLLDGEDWLDNGTGYCKGEIDKELKHPYFMVRNELDESDIILKSFLNGSIQYQRQQETLIVWTDLSGKDLALSFQETEGCAYICDFIIEMQQSLCPEISLYYVIPAINDGDEITELITGPVNYPELPNELNLELIQETITQSSSSQFTRTKVANFIIEENYVSLLIDMFAISEKQENLPNLYALNEIVKALILYGDTHIIEDILSSEEKILGLVGILEYDSEYPRHRACYRETLKNKSFKSVIPVDKLSIFKKDFHLNYIKDVVLARFLDDQTYSLIGSLIYLNQVEIINYLKNREILDQLFDIYDSHDNLTQKRNGLRMLHQYVLIAKGLQPGQRSEFFSILVKSGLFKMINFALMDEEPSIRVLGTELIVIIIEQDISLVNNIDEIDNEVPRIENDDKPSLTKFNLSDDMTLISILARLLVEDNNPGLKMQAFEALKILLDPMIASENEEGCNVTNFSKNHFSIATNGEQVNNNSIRISKTNSQSSQYHELAQNYFRAFYSKVAPTLFKKLIDISQDEGYSLPIDEILCQHLCELISFCSREHEVYLSRSFILENNILLGMIRILMIPSKLVAKLSVIRCLKYIILRDDVFYTRYIINNKILTIFFEFFSTVMEDNNLINSTCLDVLDIILNNSDSRGNSRRRDNFKLLANYIFVNHRRECEKIDYVDTGSKLVKLVEDNFNETCDTTSQNSINSDEEISKHDASTPVNEFDDDSDHEMGISNQPKNLFENIVIPVDDNSKENALVLKKDKSGKRSIDFDAEHEYNNRINGSLSFKANHGDSTSTTTKHKKMMLSVPSESSEVLL